ncbi:MAG: DUF952 domain-containing protein [Alphaproteobacteria bacterium TMED89]|nr:glutathione S-transferase [Rhodospirillaceae bacterium]RPH10142.1 MAG: DUF952 domain-containing protein [Alphaproteobacteria bacterium TMED89]
MAHQADWEAALASGSYHGSADDRRDGFIHFSNGALIPESAAKHRAGQRDLLLICCDPAALGKALKWERSRNGIDFPHLYRPLDPAEALWSVPLPLNDQGVHVFPEDLA